MPKPRKIANLPVKRLAQLPRRPGMVVIGGRRTLQTEIPDGKDLIHPQVVLWMDEQSQMMLGTGMVALERSTDEGISETVDMLVNGLLDAPSTEFGLPGKIVVTDAALVPKLEELFAPYRVAVEHVESLPLLDAVFADLLDSLGFSADGEPPPPFAWDVSRDVLDPLYTAAARLWRRAPWSYMLDHPTIAVKLGENGPAAGVDTLHVSILGAAGTVFGIACYTSLEAFEEAVQAGTALAEQEGGLLDDAMDFLRARGLPVDQIPPDLIRQMISPMVEETIDEEDSFDAIHQDAMVCYFDEQGDIDPTYISWMQEHELKPASRHGVPTFLRTTHEDEPRVLDARETRAMTLTIEAVCQFCSRFHAQLETEAPIEEPLTLRAHVGQDVVDVSYTPASEEALLDDELPESARTTVYRFQVKLDQMKQVWRRIELLGSHTLHDLHEAIQIAFNWDDDHLYAFFMSGKPWDKTSEYQGDPLGGGAAGRKALHALDLQPGQQFLYIFDFGDELKHRIKLEKIVPNGVEPQATYPRITESQGEAPPQYGDADEDDEE